MMNQLRKVTKQTTNTTLSMSPAILGMNLRSSGTPPRWLAVPDPGATTETISLKCNTGGGSLWTNMPVPSVGWRGGFGEANKKREYNETMVDGVAVGNPKYIFRNFQPVGKTVVAR